MCTCCPSVGSDTKTTINKKSVARIAARREQSLETLKKLQECVLRNMTQPHTPVRPLGSYRIRRSCLPGHAMAELLGLFAASTISCWLLEWNVCQAATMPLDPLPTEILGAVCEEKNWQKLQ